MAKNKKDAQKKATTPVLRVVEKASAESAEEAKSFATFTIERPSAKSITTEAGSSIHTLFDGGSIKTVATQGSSAIHTAIGGAKPKSLPTEKASSSQTEKKAITKSPAAKDASKDTSKKKH